MNTPRSLFSAIEKNGSCKSALGRATRGLAALTVVLSACGQEPTAEVDASPTEPVAEAQSTSASQGDLGRQIFFDTNLSEPPGLACATCHQESFAFADGRGGPTSEGSIRGRFGVRNAPSALYASLVPPLTEEDGTFRGGLFWDGRVASLEAQAGGPLLNPIEMGNASRGAVMAKIRKASYASTFSKVFGAAVLADDNKGFEAVAKAIATYERTQHLSRFSSKYDDYLAGKAKLAEAEARGLALFNGKANCAACHPSTPDPSMPGVGPLFTDFTYDNIGIPKNPKNPFYTLDKRFNPQGASYVDHGLRDTVGRDSEDGKFRVPTLRNIAKTAPYGHNGYFATLRSIVEFYNTRDVGSWPAPEVPTTVNQEELGNLQLTSQEIDDIVAFLNTLTDRNGNSGNGNGAGSPSGTGSGNGNGNGKTKTKTKG